MLNILIGLALFLAHALAAAADIHVVALTAGKAVVRINDGKTQMLSVGQATPEGVKLIGATSESATFEVGGKRQTLTMGQSVFIGASAVSAQRATLTADTGGHFVTTVTVNGVSMIFMVDTGASMVTLSSGNAKRAGISYLSGQKALLQTANGTVPAYRVKLDNVRLGDITLSNVDAIVIEGDRLPMALLGMSFLTRMEMKHDGQTMTLIRRY